LALSLHMTIDMDFRIPRRHGHYVFGILQSGLTCLAAAGIASYPATGVEFLKRWLVAWLLSWTTMLPVVLLAAPAIRSFVDHLPRDSAG
jgi:hypothetical protein